MRKRVTVRLRPVTPFSISQHRERNVGGTLDYVPGSTLRGALAAAWMRIRGVPGDGNDAFYRVFQSGRNRFPFCYPGTGMPGPAPLTARTCKAHPGPLVAGGHGVFDGAGTLLDASREEQKKCPTDGCGERMVRWGGLVPRNDRGKILGIIRETRMHAGIRRATGSVREGVLFGTRVVVPWARPRRDSDDIEELVLEGTGFFEEDDVGELATLLEECEGTVFVGRSRSSGLGEMRVQLSVESAADDSAERRFAEWEKAKVPVPEGDGLPVALTLLSPAILERDGAYIFDPVAFLSERLGLTAGMPLVQRTLVFGWNMKEGAPKPVAEAISAGSLLLGRSRLSAADLVERVRDLEADGIGERREEGYGQVLSWDPVLAGGVR